MDLTEHAIKSYNASEISMNTEKIKSDKRDIDIGVEKWEVKIPLKFQKNKKIVITSSTYMYLNFSKAYKNKHTTYITWTIWKRTFSTLGKST